MSDSEYAERLAVEDAYRAMSLDLARRRAAGLDGAGCLAAPSGITAAASFLDPQTRADEVRVIRARMGFPLGMSARPDLERKRADGSIERLLGPGA